MRRLLLAFGVLTVPLLCAPLMFAAGLFQVGEKAPSFPLAAITGETVSLESYKGKLVLGLFHICDYA